MSKTIFVVDDNGTNLAMVEAALEKEFRVITMSSAVKMFTILEKVMPDLILLDIEMPEMTGFEALDKLKTNASYAHIPVMLLTGLTAVANKIRGIELGAVDFITKPFSELALLHCVKSHLNVS